MYDLAARELWEYDQKVRFEWIDIFGSLATAILILVIAFIYQNQKITKDPSYKYFVPGLVAKIGGTIIFCSIYLFYYDGGDTTAYFESSMALTNLFYKSTSNYFEVLFSAPNSEIRSLFDDKTGYPYSYMFYDSHTFMVIKLTSIFTIITSKSYFLTSLLISFLCFLGMWKLFQTIRFYTPKIDFKIAIGVLFFPSALFWSGGVSKDTFTFMATALFVYCAHQTFILKNRKSSIIFILLLSTWLILNIKPYIFLILFPGGLLWIFYEKLTRVRSAFITIIIFPIMLVSISLLSFYVLSQLGGTMSKFSIEKAFETAAVTNYDLKQDYYGGSSFDIGDFDGTLTGVFKLFFPALNAGLFRPYVWEARSLVIFIAGLENLFLLGLTVYILFKSKIKGAFIIITSNPLLLFCTIFSILFAFMIGLTTSNFGAIVRFKIPLIPFYISALFVTDYLYNERKKIDRNF